MNTTPNTLNDDQQSALTRIIDWLHNSDDPFFVLKGSAGTGKTFCIRELVNQTRGKFVFTAPTNKATKVLRESVTRDDYQPDCRTIFSLLGLRIEASGEIKELKVPDGPIDLSQFKAVIVDEGSMVNKVLMNYIQFTAEKFSIKFLFMGDPAQLPPVGEVTSLIWQLPHGAELTKVMRHDNQILELAVRIRDQVNRFAPTVKLAASNDGEEGVWKREGQAFLSDIHKHVAAGAFSQPSGSKVIAWRNVEVDRFNKLIRDAIFDVPMTPWLVGDRILFTAPAKNLEDEIIASTDDEGTVTRVDTEWHAVYGQCKVFRLSITLDDNRPVVGRVLHPESAGAFAAKLAELSAAAKANSRKWKEFWHFKEAFHSVRYAYAITAHRAQGSTYDTAFVFWQDILLNRNRQEAYRCLYVACTRPKRALILS